MWKKTKFFTLMLLVLFLLDMSRVSARETTSRSSVGVCITNCVQCKQMFGRFFEGQICADTCMTTDGTITPDCNNPGSIGKYLKRFY